LQQVRIDENPKRLRKTKRRHAAIGLGNPRRWAVSIQESPRLRPTSGAQGHESDTAQSTRP
jgi:hypothetical protein